MLKALKKATLESGLDLNGLQACVGASRGATLEGA